MNALIIIVEVSIVIIIFLFLIWLVGNLSKLLIKYPLFNINAQRVKILRRNMTGLLLLTGFVLCLVILGVNGFLIYQGKDIQKYTLDLIKLIPPGFWLKLAVGIAQSIGTVILAAIALKFINYCLNIANTRAKNLDSSTADDESIDTFFTELYKRIKWGSWLWIIGCCSLFLNLPAIISDYLFVALRIYLIIAVGLLIIKAAAAIVDILDALSVRYSNPDNLLRFYDPLRHLIPFFKRCLELVLYACIATLVTQQIEFIANLSDFWLRVIKIITLIFLSRVFYDVVYLLAEELVFKEKKLTERQRSRRLTLVPLFRSILQYSIYFTVGVSILYTLDIDPTPILAGAGIIGLAVGFGAQELVNDMVCGFFILFEHYYLVGDYIEAGNVEEKVVEGTVEAIELRTTRLRHPNGQLQIIRNGAIGSVINYSKEYIFAVVEVCIPYHANLAQVYQVVEEVGQELNANDPDVLEPTQIDGVESLGESNLLLKTLTKAKPGKHLQIQRTLRKMFMDTLRSEGILLPAPIKNEE
ncbi:transporter, MscS family [Coleofasciculus chthonoplastes PCC 7420]|uniref:Transporter, MscS family n=1 Tax=Coleofasciculus chthonoplastes PCC 7420 TaxID=118168 RepID=B4VR40_9CYAN|nr:mechanosensitive ion channel family protein [Coleofasciculus chthonoplastes]EDX75412.1 transporter, MscS family [Coleofasciculus chthonoplastes PCC 7420]